MNEGSFAYDGLDRVLHERARLSILTALSTADKGRTFGDLKRLCELTDGNLNRHLKVLEEAALVRITKRGEGRASETRVRLSAGGRRAFVTYLGELERVLRDARGTEPVREGTGRDTETDAGPDSGRPAIA
ncbi:MAG: transcriptional regulator [Planctomycetota bacterium]